MKLIFDATKQHSQNLALFVSFYKILLLVQRKLKGKQEKMDVFMAGLIAGYYVFGTDNGVNQQVSFLHLISCLLYLLILLNLLLHPILHLLLDPILHSILNKLFNPILHLLLNSILNRILHLPLHSILNLILNLILHPI